MSRGDAVDETTHPDEEAGPESAADQTLEGRLRRLEEIMTKLEADEVALEEALELFEEGVGHVRAAEKILAETELKVEELLADGSTGALDGVGDEDGS